MDVQLSPLEEKRFGIRTARGVVTAGTLRDSLAFCEANDVRLLIARVPANDLATAQALEARRALLCDTLVYYGRKLDDAPEAVGLRMATPDDAPVVRDLAAVTFLDYLGHYHADQRLDRAKVAEVYPDWARRACLASPVLIAEDGRSVVAFATLRQNNTEEGEGVLFGVHPSAQGRGLYRALMLGGMRWCCEHGLSSMVVSTQLPNLAVQKVWCRLGFEPKVAYHTFHLWFPPKPPEPVIGHHSDLLPWE